MRYLLGLSVAALVSVPALGCAGDPAPEGYHYEYSRSGKSQGRVLEPDVDPRPTYTIVTQVETGSDVPGPGETSLYKPEGKRVRRVVVRDVVTTVTVGDPVEVPAPDRCPECRPVRVQAGKQSQVRWYCNLPNHPDLKAGRE